MPINRLADEFLLGKKNRIIKSKDIGFSWHTRQSTPKKSSSSVSSAKLIINAAQNKPEVVVKIPKRHGSSSGLKGIKGNLDYISRNGDLDLEDQDGNLISGKSEINKLLTEYKALGIERESRRREALNIVLSMPPNTDPQAVKDASREFAKEHFKGFRWVMVQHLDTKHPHCHINVLMTNEKGKRLNPNLKTLAQWRVSFAKKMIEQGVDCSATRRTHRGKFNKSEDNTVRHIRKRKGRAFVQQKQIEEIVQALGQHQRPTNPLVKEILQQQNIVVEQYAHLSKALYAKGLKDEAAMISNLRKSLQNADIRSQTQKKYDKTMKDITEPMPEWAEVEQPFKQPEFNQNKTEHNTQSPTGFNLPTQG